MNPANLMHGLDFDGQDVTGWTATEKLNGCRARWQNGRLWTRTGNPIAAPVALTAALPVGMVLDMEVHAGRGGFEQARQAVQLGRWGVGIMLTCFDAPEHPGGWQERIAIAQQAGVECVPGVVVTSKRHLARMFQQITQDGGESLMLHRPGSNYAPGRTADLLKMK
jgi:DNA ligase-1